MWFRRKYIQVLVGVTLLSLAGFFIGLFGRVEAGACESVTERTCVMEDDCGWTGTECRSTKSPNYAPMHGMTALFALNVVVGCVVLIIIVRDPRTGHFYDAL